MFLFARIVLSVTILIFSACTEKSEAEKLRQYYSILNAENVDVNPATGPHTNLPSPGTPPAPNTTQIFAGTPRVGRDGICGDGIINGTTEDCDQGAIQNTSCRDYGGIAGEVRCQSNCLYDISECMTPRANHDIGGLADSCKCNCNASPCSGGCTSTALNGPAICQFDCDNECVCQCEGRLYASIEECKFRCACVVDGNGNPDCSCNMDECDLITTVDKNIANVVTSNVQLR